MNALIAAIVGGIAGAVAGAAMTGLTIRWQLSATASHRAIRVIQDHFRRLASQLEAERRAGFPTINTNVGPFAIERREKFVVDVLRETPDLRKHQSTVVEDGLVHLLGEEAVLYTQDRVFAEPNDIDLDAERAAKSRALISKIHAGTFQAGLVPSIGKAAENQRDQAIDDAIAAIYELVGRLGKRRSARSLGRRRHRSHGLQRHGAAGSARTGGAQGPGG
ncbi:hypothetical protein [Microbacterium capsulatum]|uniref:Secreted protein n=1 Tax=Microbacterium capsulatum TaxID=3041921 RepID=A0ABU0XF39_9MICO|nr:hypothetical protein [Microbacterium sp. ASV81]MDQ4213734.1 hypothetical protein [Microbacterium sp. ASV81]